MITTLTELREQIRHFNLERLEEQLVRLAAPCIYITRTPVDSMDALPIGASRLGGLPDLPADFAWKYYEGKPLTFIAQFRFADLAPYDVENVLPRDGMLYFFYEMDSQPWGIYDERDGWAVVYVDDARVPLVRTPHPTHPTFELKQGRIDALPPHSITFVRGISLLDFPYEKNQYYGITFQNRDEEDTHSKLLTSLRPKLAHQILGYPWLEQADAREGCIISRQPYEQRPQYPKTPEGQAMRIEQIESWQLLFQIDTDNSLDVMWGDVGKLYICIPNASLAARRFEDCWMVLQCG